MENLWEDLERMKITGNLLTEQCIELIKKTYCPQQIVGLTRPCEEKDFNNYRNTLDSNLHDIQLILRQILQEHWQTNNENSKIFKTIGMHLILIVGEQSEKSPWNTPKSLIISQNILTEINRLFNVTNLSQLFGNSDNDYLSTILMMLRPKLLRDTWKTYPSAVICYKWILHQVQIPDLVKQLFNILPTALIIFDDFVPENRIIGLECIYKILQHSSMQSELIDNGYNNVLYQALEKLTHERDVRYIIPLYACLTQVLTNFEFENKSADNLEWTRRDDVIVTLLDNMELEQDLGRRHAYMTSLSQLLTNIGCAKWCGRITKIISEYCAHHTELRTLRATLQVAETVLTIFHCRTPAYCTTLYSAFLKLHFDLIETPIFDEEILKLLERCIHTLYKLTPTIGSSIIRDDRMRIIMKNSLHLGCHDDTKYCN